MAAQKAQSMVVETVHWLAALTAASTAAHSAVLMVVRWVVGLAGRMAACSVVCWAVSSAVL